MTFPLSRKLCMDNENTLKIITYGSCRIWARCGLQHSPVLPGVTGFTAQNVHAVCSEPRLQWSCRVQYRRAPPESREPQVHYAFHFDLSFDWYIFRTFFMLSNSLQSSHSVTWARNILASLCFWFLIDFWLVHFQKPYWTATFLSNPHIWFLDPHVESRPAVYEDTLPTTPGAEMRSGLCNLLPGNQRRKKNQWFTA